MSDDRDKLVVGDAVYVSDSQGKWLEGLISKIGRKWIIVECPAKYQFDRTNGYQPRPPIYGHAPILRTYEQHSKWLMLGNLSQSLADLQECIKRSSRRLVETRSEDQILEALCELRELRSNLGLPEKGY